MADAPSVSLLTILPNSTVKTVSLILAKISASLDIASFSITMSSPSEADIMVLPVKMRDGFSATERSPSEADVVGLILRGTAVRWMDVILML